MTFGTSSHPKVLSARPSSSHVAAVVVLPLQHEVSDVERLEFFLFGKELIGAQLVVHRSYFVLFLVLQLELFLSAVIRIHKPLEHFDFAVD